MATKAQLEVKLSELEDQLHVSENSAEYWANEAEMYMDKYQQLKYSLEDNKLYQLTKNCTLRQSIQIEEFVKKITE